MDGTTEAPSHPPGTSPTSTAGCAARFNPVRDWWPDHIEPPRSSFVSARNAPRMWRL